MPIFWHSGMQFYIKDTPNSTWRAPSKPKPQQLMPNTMHPHHTPQTQIHVTNPTCRTASDRRSCLHGTIARRDFRRDFFVGFLGRAKIFVFRFWEKMSCFEYAAHKTYHEIYPIIAKPSETSYEILKNASTTPTGGAFARFWVDCARKT